jgi:hypothetical protein
MLVLIQTGFRESWREQDYIVLKEEHRLKVFEIWVLRKIFGPKNAKVAEEWSRLHNEELHELFSSPNIILVIEQK